MAELLDNEEKGLNIFVNGPGYVKTRIHEETLRAKAAAGEGYAKTVALLEAKGPRWMIYMDICNGVCCMAAR